MSDDQRMTAVLTLLRGYLANASLPVDGRLPSERQLAETLEVSRPEIRKALSVLENKGQLWRHVGKGTFLGPRPVASINGIIEISERIDIETVMEARGRFEPMLAAMAAQNATKNQVRDMRDLVNQGWEEGLSWRAFEGLDATLHRGIASASGNSVLLHLFDELSAIRRTVTWTRVRIRPSGPTKDHHSFHEHKQIVEAIATRDPEAAAARMVAHISKVREQFEMSATKEAFASVDSEA